MNILLIYRNLLIRGENLPIDLYNVFPTAFSDWQVFLTTGRGQGYNDYLKRIFDYNLF